MLSSRPVLLANLYGATFSVEALELEIGAFDIVAVFCCGC